MNQLLVAGQPLHRPPTLSSEPIQVSNADFVNGIFLDIPMGAQVLSCVLEGDPERANSWGAMPKEALFSASAPGCNTYVNSGTFRPDHRGELKAKRNNCAACHVLLLDDLGSKIPLERVSHFPLSFLNETSPGNYQGGIILERPETDLDKVDRIHRALIAAGLCDPGAGGPSTRWLRASLGVNGKAKYLHNGLPFQCQLRVWNPAARYSLEAIRDGFELSMSLAPKRSWTSPEIDQRPVASRTIRELALLLEVIDADCPYRDWLNVLLAIHHETGGSEEGLDLVDSWSSTGSKYAGRYDLETKWRSFRDYSGSPVTLGTIYKMVRDAGEDWMELLDAAGEQFEPCATTIVEVNHHAPAVPQPTPANDVCHSLLAKYSLRERLAELERTMVDQRPILGEIILLGQATVIYATPNTGKTLTILALALMAIDEGRIDPSKLFYVNMDDNSKGLVEKTRIAQEYGFEMLADGYQGFQADRLREAMVEMVETNTAAGVVIVLDTLKKFVNTMNKDATSDFNKIIRRFVMRGGTLVALAHTNKKLGPDGEPVYSGTSDVVDDFDCAYTVQAVDVGPTATERVIKFKNFKRRGDVPPVAAYRYACGRTVGYAELLMSVEPVSPEDIHCLTAVAEQHSDSQIIAAIAQAIRDGITTKMKILSHVGRGAQWSRRTITQVLEKYTGNDASIHRWRIVTAKHNRYLHVLHESPSAQVEPTG